MATLKQKHFTWLSLALLLVTYTWFGWYLAGLQARPLWMTSACYRVFGAPLQEGVDEPAPRQQSVPEPEPVPMTSPAPAIAPPAEIAPPPPDSSHSSPTPPSPTAPSAKPAATPSQTTDFSRTMCTSILKYNLHAGLLAVVWIIVSSIAFISPLTSLNTFINRFFQSDTVAIMTIFIIAGMAAIILYWLHVFLQIFTILAVDILARIDIQYVGLSGVQAFWILTLVSLVGLVFGWTANALI